MNSPGATWPNAAPMNAPFGGVSKFLLFSRNIFLFRWAFNKIQCGNNHHHKHHQPILLPLLLAHRYVITTLFFSLSVSCYLPSSNFTAHTYLSSIFFLSLSFSVLQRRRRIRPSIFFSSLSLADVDSNLFALATFSLVIFRFTIVVSDSLAMLNILVDEKEYINGISTSWSSMLLSLFTLSLLYTCALQHISTEKKRQTGNNQIQNTSRTNVLCARSLVAIMSLSDVCVCGRTYTTLLLFFPVPLSLFCTDESQSFDFMYVVGVAAALSRKKMLLYELFCGFIFDVF
jgi:hypothetical protein